MSRTDYHKQLRKFRKAARKLGIDSFLAPNGHYTFLFPDGGKIQAPGSSSDWRAIRNLRCRCRRRGYNIP